MFHREKSPVGEVGSDTFKKVIGIRPQNYVCKARVKQSFQATKSVHLSVKKDQIIHVLSLKNKHHGWIEVQDMKSEKGAVPFAYVEMLNQQLDQPSAKSPPPKVPNSMICTSCHKRIGLPPQQTKKVRCPLCQATNIVPQQSPVTKDTQKALKSFSKHSGRSANLPFSTKTSEEEFQRLKKQGTALWKENQVQEAMKIWELAVNTLGKPRAGSSFLKKLNTLHYNMAAG